ncbi:unnamed protein product [Amoebophrya sp. A120]|nr:unnamed protein product [Amoebophrya sp. A120]|eukprot:GSA120T00017173001.1
MHDIKEGRIEKVEFLGPSSVIAQYNDSISVVDYGSTAGGRGVAGETGSGERGSGGRTMKNQLSPPGHHKTYVPAPSPSNKFAQAVLAPGSREAFFALVREHVPQFAVGEVPPEKLATRFFRGLLQLAVPSAFLAVWYQLLKSIIDKKEDYDPSKQNRRQSNLGNPKDRQVKLSDITLPHAVKQELFEVVDLLNHPEKYRHHGVVPFRGVLLTGPSGTGKTMVARAVAYEAEAAFLSCVGSELIELYVGRGAARVRAIFAKARQLACAASGPGCGTIRNGKRWNFGSGTSRNRSNCTSSAPPTTPLQHFLRAAAGSVGASKYFSIKAGTSRQHVESTSSCVLFFDEIDAVGARTGSSSRIGSSGPHDEVIQTVNQLLHELDGFGCSASDDRVLVLGATNRYEALDSALLRPGRFDRQIFLRLPTAKERGLILENLLRKKPVLLFPELGETLETLCADEVMGNTSSGVCFSGADVAHIVMEAVYNSLRREPQILVRKIPKRERGGPVPGAPGTSTYTSATLSPFAFATSSNKWRPLDMSVLQNHLNSGRSAAAAPSTGATNAAVEKKPNATRHCGPGTAAAASRSSTSGASSPSKCKAKAAPAKGVAGGTGASSSVTTGTPAARSCNATTSSSSSVETPFPSSTTATPTTCFTPDADVWEQSGRLALGRPREHATVSITGLGAASPTGASGGSYGGQNSTTYGLNNRSLISLTGTGARNESRTQNSNRPRADSTGAFSDTSGKSDATFRTPSSSESISAQDVASSRRGNERRGSSGTDSKARRVQEEPGRRGALAQTSFYNIGSSSAGSSATSGSLAAGADSATNTNSNSSSDSSDDDEDENKLDTSTSNAAANLLSRLSDHQPILRSWMQRAASFGTATESLNAAGPSGGVEAPHELQDHMTKPPRVAILYCDLEKAVARVAAQVRTRAQGERWKLFPGGGGGQFGKDGEKFFAEALAV